MSLANLSRRLGNELYRGAFPVYRHLYGLFKSYADREERALIRHRLTPGAVVVDAGANIGIYTKFVAHCVGPTGIVHSFEPAPENFSRLQQALAGLPNVRLNQLAVSNATGESSLYVSDDLNVDHRAYPTPGEERRTVAIQTIRLDDYFRPGERLDFIKMDIQGYELKALRGAERVLADNPSITLLLEFWPYGLVQAGDSGQALASFLQTRGFSVNLPAERKSVKLGDLVDDASDPLHYFNLFAKRN